MSKAGLGEASGRALEAKVGSVDFIVKCQGHPPEGFVPGVTHSQWCAGRGSQGLVRADDVCLFPTNWSVASPWSFETAAVRVFTLQKVLAEVTDLGFGLPESQGLNTYQHSTGANHLGFKHTSLAALWRMNYREEILQ